jgi:hypothetical protein
MEVGVNTNFLKTNTKCRIRGLDIGYHPPVIIPVGWEPHGTNERGEQILVSEDLI